MPGKHDFSTGAAVGQYAPGSKEMRAWDEGWLYRYSGTGPTRPITDNPFDQTALPAEYDAWNAGWTEAHGNSAGLRRMPATTGLPTE